MSVPDLRLRRVNGGPVRRDAPYVLYWMVAERRTRWNFALDRALEWCRELGRPLVVLEALRADYPFACDRFHRFVTEGMLDQHRRLGRDGILYHPYVEPEPGAGKGLLAALSAAAAVVVTDDRPAFFLPKMVTAAGAKLAVRLEAVDGSGLLPVRAAERVFPTAFAFRRFLHEHLGRHLGATPRADPLARLTLPPASALPAAIVERWPAWSPGPEQGRGGERRARKRLSAFVAGELPRYGDVYSGLSPYLHFGHVSPHEVFARVAKVEGWSKDRLAPGVKGRREGYWGMSGSAEAFLDQLVTWRELGLSASARLPRHDRYESLPAWARTTLEDHEGDEREYLYSLEEFEGAATHDELWNAAQTQLVRDGTIHSYLRMLWGKKILEWTASPREALEVMLHLNDKYALDGRDPNSVSGVFWCLGRYDRAWGPERPVFGKIRFMSSKNTRRKIPVKDYLEKYR